MSDDTGLSRRRFLSVATTVTGVVGAGFAATPFIASWQPSARARALGAPVEVDISKLEDGALMKVTWRGKPVSILRRSSEMLKRMENSSVALRDPESEEDQQPNYARNEFRSVLQALFLFNALFVITVHAIAGNLTASIGRYYLYAAPALILGIAVGSMLDHRITPQRFRVVVNVMILLLGLSLLV